jgi:hypothetical protein
MSTKKNSYNEIRKVLISVKKAFDEGRLSAPGNYPSEESLEFIKSLQKKIDSVLAIPKRKCDEYDDWREAYGEFVRSDEFEDAGDEEIFKWILGELDVEDS